MPLARRASVLGLALLLGVPLLAASHASAAPRHAPPALAAKGRHKKAAVHHAPPPVTVKVSAGFAESVRTSAWAPITVTLHNRSNSLFSGTVDIPDSYSNNQGGPPQPYHALYEEPVTLPPGTTKQVVLYVPGSDVGNNGVDVNVRRGNILVASTNDSPGTFDDQQLSIGVFTNDPTTTAWLRQDNPLPETPGYIRLSPTTLVPMAGALDSFDIIALSNANIAALDSAQRHALVGYVRDGGGLILVGGPDWQETLRSLPSSLLPGRLSGAATVSGLSGLNALSRRPPPRGRTTLSVLTRPAGMVLARQGSIPLAVQASLGEGRIIYLAFDPSVDPVLHWSGASGLLTDIVRRAAPAAVMRGMMANGGGPISNGPFFGKFGYGPMNIGGELANVPAAALPSILLFILLTIFYILLLGPANVLVLRRLHRRELAWVTIPAGALLCLAITFGMAFHLKGNTVLVNTIGVLQLNGNDGPQPFAQYIGLFAPVRGDYTLTDNMTALPSAVPQFFYGGPPQSGNPLGLRFQEGDGTRVDFLSMNMWSMRSVVLHSTVNVTGAIRSRLHVTSTGWIVGAVHNDTRLTLVHPSIIAGTSTARIADLPPEATVRVRIKPTNDVLTHVYGRAVWYKMYGSARYGGDYYPPQGMGISAVMTGRAIGGGGYCCFGPSPPPEKTFIDRIRDAAQNLPEAQAIADIGEVTLVGWTEQPFGTINVDGAAPQRRDLTLVTAPLQVRFPRGPFTLRTGVLGAQLIDQDPKSPQNACCAQQGQSIFLINGGWAVLGFNIPQAAHIRWSRLDLGLDAGGAYAADICSVYDWHHNRWVHEDVQFGYTRLKDPARFVSPAGIMLVRLHATSGSNAIRISDIHHALQLRGRGVVT